jgi:hypothetical protein
MHAWLPETPAIMAMAGVFLWSSSITLKPGDAAAA